MHYTLYSFSRGQLFIAGSPKGLNLIHFLKHPDEVEKILSFFQGLSIPIELNEDKFHKEMRLFDRYFSGKKESFENIIPHYLSGTPYQKSVWSETRNIPYGRTVFYKTIAHKLNHKGYRSVGQALNKNPLLILVPCHRVIGSDGSLRGFGAGLEIKEFLLNLESSGNSSRVLD